MKAWAFLAALLLPLIVSGAAAAESPPNLVPASKPSLYLHQAKQGSLKRQGDQWVLTLHGSAPKLTTFTSRPQQISSPHELKSFVSDWRDTFGDTRPQAALEITDAPASRDVILLELSPPRFGNGSGTVSYEVRPLTQTSRTALAALAERADGNVAEHFRRASLYIEATGGTVSLLIYWTSIGGTFSLGFDTATIFDGTLMSDFTAGNYVAIEPQGVDGQSWDPTALFQGAIQSKLTLPPSGPVTGSTAIPPGFTLQVSLCNGTPVTLPNGEFSIPIPTEGC